jgi:hypothetical protein
MATQGSHVWFLRVFIAFLSVGMITAFFAGSRLGRRFHQRTAGKAGAGIQTVNTAL